MNDFPVPIGCPPRSELWRRIRLAESILSHRVLVPDTTRQELLQVLRGETAVVPDPREAG